MLHLVQHEHTHTHTHTHTSVLAVPELTSQLSRRLFSDDITVCTFIREQFNDVDNTLNDTSRSHVAIIIIIIIIIMIIIILV